VVGSNRRLKKWYNGEYNGLYTFLSAQIKDDEMGRIYFTHGIEEKCRLRLGNLTDSAHCC